MGVASVILVYDLVRRRFGRAGGFVAGLALAVTPITVAVSRHNNPDALLALCCVAALWFAVRALEDGRTRWLVLAGVAVGLGFETKMGVALAVVPGIAAAWLWVAPAARGRLRALRQLIAGAGAMVLVGGAWPALVEAVPASARPWISGTSDNSVLSLIFGYNGLGRVDGQSGGPGGPGGSFFGGSPGPLRLLNSALGGQAGWLLGFAAVGGLAIVLASRLRRSDPRSGWLIAVGGAFATTALLFSFASGIFHPYYVSLLAPFAAALTGAGAAQLLEGGRRTRLLAASAVLVGVACELVVRSRYPGQLDWLPPVLVAAGLLAAVALIACDGRRARAAALAGAVAALLLAPSAWALDTLGHAESGTFPAGGPASVATAGAPFGGLGARRFGLGAPPGGAPGAGVPGGPAAAGGPPPRALGRAGAPLPGGQAPRAPGPGARLRAGPAGATQAGPGGGGGPFGSSQSLNAILAYVRTHGGGTVAVSSQSSAASAIIAKGAAVAGIGGFSGRESDVSARWLGGEVGAGRIRWVLVEDRSGGLGGGLAGDTRTGARTAMAAVASACTRVQLSEASSGSSLYDCSGHATDLARAGKA
jgi:hypothetical protein